MGRWAAGPALITRLQLIEERYAARVPVGVENFAFMLAICTASNRVRVAQRVYFETREQEHLRAAFVAEKELDDLLNEPAPTRG